MFKKVDVLVLFFMFNRKVKNFKYGVLLIFLFMFFIFCLFKLCICIVMCNVDNNRIKKFLFRFGSIVEDDRDILIYGMLVRNRVVYGDLVVVEVLLRLEWRGRLSVIKES